MKNFFYLIFVTWSIGAYSQNTHQDNTSSQARYNYRVSLPGIILPQLVEKSWNDRQHTQHIELHVKRELNEKNIIGIKFATWRLFQPMGILWWDGLLDKLDTQSEFYPGHVRETGLGVSYQRMLWKGLFTTAEVLPQLKTYLNEENNKVGTGFKLYTSLHLGYHISLGKKKRLFLEPQVHSQIWVFDTNTPEEFKTLDDSWKNYFLFEPNLYIGMKF